MYYIDANMAYVNFQRLIEFQKHNPNHLLFQSVPYSP